MKSAGSIGLICGLALGLALLTGCNGNSADSAAQSVASAQASPPPQTAVLAQGSSSASSSAESASGGATSSSSSGNPQTPLTAAASTATLSWLPPTENTDGSTLTDLAGYRIYYGTSANALDQVVDISNVGITTYVLEGLTPGTWYFAIKSYASDGTESALSNVAMKTIS